MKHGGRSRVLNGEAELLGASRTHFCSIGTSHVSELLFANCKIFEAPNLPYVL